MIREGQRTSRPHDVAGPEDEPGDVVRGAEVVELLGDEEVDGAASHEGQHLLHYHRHLR